MWVALNAVLAVGLRFMLLVGETNIATGAFYGIGAYARRIMHGELRVPFPLALLAGAVVATVVSAVFGLVTLRTKGPYFMLISFAFTEVTRLIYTRINYIGGNSGIMGVFPPQSNGPVDAGADGSAVRRADPALYLWSDRTLAACSVRFENNDAMVETVGINVVSDQADLSGAGLVRGRPGGALHAHIYNVISPGDFTYLVPVFALAYVKIGGDLHVLGAVARGGGADVDRAGAGGAERWSRSCSGAPSSRPCCCCPTGCGAPATRCCD